LFIFMQSIGNPCCRPEGRDKIRWTPETAVEIHWRDILMKLLFSCLWAMAISGALWAATEPAGSQSRTQLEKAVAVYNASTGGDFDTFLASASLNARPSDKKFLEKAAVELKGRKMPHARAAGNQVFFDGLEAPLQAVDLKTATFTYKGKVTTIDPHATLEENMNRIQLVIDPKPSALANFLLPEARAGMGFQVWANGFGVLSLSLLGLFSSCNWFDHSRPDSSCSAYSVGWPFVNAAGGILAVARPGARVELPAAINCRKDRGGVAVELVASDGTRVVVRDVNGTAQFRPPLATEDDGWAYEAAGHMVLNGCQHAPARLAAVNAPLKHYTGKRRKGQLGWPQNPQTVNPEGESSVPAY
jgi:hypothetical protein